MSIRNGSLADALSRHLLLALGFTALLLGLLGMHTLGIDHVAPSHHPAATVLGNLHATPATDAVEDSSKQPWCAEGCGLEAVVAGLCVMALAGGSVLLHLATRALRAVPGRGPSAPRVRPAPHSRAAPTPSLLQLSISRT